MQDVKLPGMAVLTALERSPPSARVAYVVSNGHGTLDTAPRMKLGRWSNLSKPFYLYQSLALVKVSLQGAV